MTIFYKYFIKLLFFSNFLLFKQITRPIFVQKASTIVLCRICGTNLFQNPYRHCAMSRPMKWILRLIPKVIW